MPYIIPSKIQYRNQYIYILYSFCYLVKIFKWTLPIHLLSQSYTRTTYQIVIHWFQWYAVSFDTRVN